MSHVIDITEETDEPRPSKPVAPWVRYTATYVTHETTVTVAIDRRGASQMLSVTTEKPHWRNFATSDPPLQLLEPAFASWLEQFMAEARQRYDARTAA